MTEHRDRAPSSPEDDAARSDALGVVVRRVVRWAPPVIAVAVLCLLLGLPWWLVTGAIVVFVAIILFDA